MVKQLNRIKKAHGDLPLYLSDSESGEYQEIQSLLKIWPLNSMGCADFLKHIKGVELNTRDINSCEKYQNHRLFIIL